MTTYEKLVALKIKPRDIDTLLFCRNAIKWHRSNVAAGVYVEVNGITWLVDPATGARSSRLPSWRAWAIADAEKIAAGYPPDAAKAILNMLTIKETES